MRSGPQQLQTLRGQRALPSHLPPRVSWSALHRHAVTPYCERAGPSALSKSTNEWSRQRSGSGRCGPYQGYEHIFLTFIFVVHAPLNIAVHFIPAGAQSVLRSLLRRGRAEHDLSAF
eukprot:5714275-Alexandrium_andersonii.AAC.1